MKLFVSALIILAFTLYPAFILAQGRVLNLSERDSVMNPLLQHDNAVLLFHADEINLGTLSQDDDPVTCRFSFQNISSNAVSLTRVYTSCGCTLANYSQAPVLAGARGEMVLLFDPSDVLGQVNKYVLVYADVSGDKPIAKLSLVGRVLPAANQWALDYPYAMGNALRVKQKVIRFKNLQAGAITNERLVCYNSGDEPIKLSALLLPDYVKFSTEPEQINPGQEADIVVTIDSGLLPSTITDHFCFDIVIDGIAGEPSERTLQVNVLLQSGLIIN